MSAVRGQDLPERARRPSTEGQVAVPWLARHTLELDDGHRVQVCIAGRGVPLVVVHGFTAEGFLYAQTLSRLVSSGFKVIAVDTAGHGGTQGLSVAGADMSDYTALLRRVVEHLGVRRAVFAGHSMGGRLVTELAAQQPESTIALLLVDAIVGDTWDRRVALARLAPPVMGINLGVLVADTLTTLPVLHDPLQAMKLGRLWAPIWMNNLKHPWDLLGAGVSILRSGPSGWMLDALADQRVPVYVIHGDRDVAVPIETARDAARRAHAELVVLHGATHSWMLKDPETMPAVVAELLQDSLGDAIWAAAAAEGLDPADDTVAGLESALYDQDALVLRLTPELRFSKSALRRRPPRYRWTRTVPPQGRDGGSGPHTASLDRPTRRGNNKKAHG